MARECAQEAGVPRLSPFHLDCVIGETGEEGALQVIKVIDQIKSMTRAQVPTPWRRGTIYCFHTRQAITPPDDSMIFLGYNMLGRPQWGGFLQACIDAQLSNIDELFATPPRPLGLIQSPPFGASLIPEITEGKLYEVLGQIAIGPISPSFRPPREGEDRRVLSVQVILSKPELLPLQIRINLMGLREEELYEGEAQGTAQGKPRGPLGQAASCIRQAQRRIRKIEDQVRLSELRGYKLYEQVNQTLSWLKDALLRTLHQRDQRTAHAQHRHQTMSRPTREAQQDAMRAGDERLFYDTHQETIIVIGPKARAHVFSEHGLHITSMRLGTGEIERKQNQRRWCALDPERMSQFREQLKRDRQ